jgi:hypothetical protein
MRRFVKILKQQGITEKVNFVSQKFDKKMFSNITYVPANLLFFLPRSTT